VNPARSPRLKLPHAPKTEVDPPTSIHVEALLEAISPIYRLPLRILDGTGLRVGELQALTWGDIDFRASRLRVARGRTKGRTAGGRWIPLSATLRDAIAALVPPEDRDLASFLLPGFSDQGLRLAMTRACKHAGIPAYTPHDLRHRYITLLVMAEVPLPIVRQIVGHSRASITLDIYSHVLLDEPPELLAERRRLVMERISRDAPVMHREVPLWGEILPFAGDSSKMEDSGLEPLTFALPARRSPS
jgi:integrase